MPVPDPSWAWRLGLHAQTLDANGEHSDASLGTNVYNVDDYGADPTGSTSSYDAFQDTFDAFDASDASGTIVIPGDSHYVISGALQDTGARNAQIVLPTVTTGEPQRTLRILGLGGRPPFAPAGPIPDPGGYSIIESDLTGATGTAAVFSGGNQVFTSKNNLQVVIENILCLAPDNPTFTFWNISSCQGGGVKDLMVTMAGWAATAVPTNSNSYGLRLPQRGQSNYTFVDGYTNYIFYTGIQIGELTRAKGLVFAGNNAAVELTEAPHPSIIENMHHTGSARGIRVAPGTSTYPVQCDIQLYNAERVDVASGALVPIVYDLDDSSNRYVGTINYAMAQFGGAIDENFYVNGGTGAVLKPVGDRRRWEAVTDGTDVFVWEGTDLVHEWKEY